MALCTSLSSQTNQEIKAPLKADSNATKTSNSTTVNMFQKPENHNPNLMLKKPNNTGHTKINKHYDKNGNLTEESIEIK